MKRRILIADSSHARVFELTDTAPMRMIRALKHDESRSLSSEIGSDHPGKVRKGMAGAARSAMEPRTPPHQIEIDRFASEIGAFLQHDFDQQHFDSLAIFAPPQFLGRLRNVLSEPLKRCLETCDTTDYAHVPEEELQQTLAPSLPGWFTEPAQA